MLKSDIYFLWEYQPIVARFRKLFFPGVYVRITQLIDKKINVGNFNVWFVEIGYFIVALIIVSIRFVSHVLIYEFFIHELLNVYKKKRFLYMKIENRFSDSLLVPFKQVFWVVLYLNLAR